MGDFNINIPMDEHNNNTCTLLDIMYSMSFIPLITRPTRITSTKGFGFSWQCAFSRGGFFGSPGKSNFCKGFIDNIFCNILLKYNTRVNGVLYTDISDHLRPANPETFF